MKGPSSLTDFQLTKKENIPKKEKADIEIISPEKNEVKVKTFAEIMAEKRKRRQQNEVVVVSDGDSSLTEPIVSSSLKFN